jgi:hypothetical protein
MTSVRIGLEMTHNRLAAEKMVQRSNALLTGGTRFVGYPAGRSFSFDPSFLDDRPPFLDLGLLQGAKCLGCLLVARKNLLPEIGETALHCRISQGFDDGGIQLRDDDWSSTSSSARASRKFR